MPRKFCFVPYHDLPSLVVVHNRSQLSSYRLRQIIMPFKVSTLFVLQSLILSVLISWEWDLFYYPAYYKPDIVYSIYQCKFTGIEMYSVGCKLPGTLRTSRIIYVISSCRNSLNQKSSSSLWRNAFFFFFFFFFLMFGFVKDAII